MRPLGPVSSGRCMCTFWMQIAMAAVRSVVVVAQRARSDGSTVCHREVSRSCSRSTSGPEDRGWNVETTNPRTMGPTYDLSSYTNSYQ